MITIKCAICGTEYKQTYNWGEGVVEVAPHGCDLIELSFVERVCNNGCPNLIRCRRDGFECREAWTASSESTKLTNREAWEPTSESRPTGRQGDWIGGHELYVRGDR